MYNLETKKQEDIMDRTKLGPLQIDMLGLIEAANSRCYIQRDPVSKRVASSLQKRGLLGINRDTECWIVWLK